MDENQPQIIIHKSNWGKQLIVVIIFLVILVALMVKNPNRRDFVQACVKEFLKQDKNMDASTSNLVSEITSNVFGTWFEPLVERDDYLVFSMYTVDINNDRYKMKITAVGIWGKIIFTDFSKVDNETIDISDPENIEITEDAADYDFYYDDTDDSVHSFFKINGESIIYEEWTDMDDLYPYEIYDNDDNYYYIKGQDKRDWFKLAIPKNLSESEEVFIMEEGEWKNYMTVQDHWSKM